MNKETDRQPWAARFFTIWTGQAVSLLGSHLVRFALIWWLTKETGSARVLATASGLSLLPQVFLGPLAGTLVDRWNRRRVMLLADGLIAAATAVLMVLAWTGAIEPWHIYGLMFVRAVGGVFHWPAMQASTSLMVPKEELSRVAGMNQTLQGALNVVGPALGAGLVSVMPLHGTLAIDVGTALIAIFLLLLVEIPQPENHRDETVTILQDLASGFNYVWSWPGLFAILIIAALLNFVSAPAFSLLPLLVTERFSGGVARVGFMNSTLGAGLLLGGLVLSAWGGFSSKILTSMTALIGGGVGMLLTGISPPGAFWLAVTGIFVEGFMNPIINGPFFALIQEKVAPEMQGRVFTLVMSFSMAVSPLGMALAGPVGDRFGVNVWFALAGVTMIGSGALSLLSPTIRNIEQQQAEDSEAVQETAAPTPEPVLAGD